VLRPRPSLGTASASSSFPVPGPALDLPFSLWTAARLADHLAELTGMRMSTPSVCRLLREGGMSLSRPQHSITSRDSGYAFQIRAVEAARANLKEGEAF
jgi:hypothetical protein